ncbi:hypothetical protein DFH11DRAFT_1622712 [Phellopilus nigrolimitatus]|nr:hypothetical protein DFH11DRAFT_1622712 [Phellopilus nigrolimitatus]
MYMYVRCSKQRWLRVRTGYIHVRARRRCWVCPYWRRGGRWRSVLLGAITRGARAGVPPGGESPAWAFFFPLAARAARPRPRCAVRARTYQIDCRLLTPERRARGWCRDFGPDFSVKQTQTHEPVAQHRAEDTSSRKEKKKKKVHKKLIRRTHTPPPRSRPPLRPWAAKRRIPDILSQGRGRGSAPDGGFQAGRITKQRQAGSKKKKREALRRRHALAACPRPCV